MGFDIHSRISKLTRFFLNKQHQLMTEAAMLRTVCKIQLLKLAAIAVELCKPNAANNFTAVNKHEIRPSTRAVKLRKAVERFVKVCGSGNVESVRFEIAAN